MKKKLKYLDEEITYYKLNNGMLVYLIPNKKKKKYDVSLCVRYGSCNRKYKIGKKEVVDISGIAHYLEHQLFTMPTEDSFNYFSKSGTTANAATSYFATKYFISGSKCFFNNLNYFLKMIYTPYFTDKSVNKERGIIKEEVMMYDDHVDWIIDNKFRKNIFNKHFIRDKIAGNVEDIMKITKEDLYQAYNYFYIPSNMILTISGNFDVEKTIEYLNKLKFLDKPNHKINEIKCDEDELTNSEYGELYGNTNIPKVCYGFKINKDKLGIKDNYLINMYLNCLFFMLFDEPSEFREEVYREKYCTTYYIDHLNVDNYYVLSFNADSNYADLFKDTIDKYLNNLKLNEDDFNRTKKILIASEIRVSDNLNVIADGIMNDFIRYNKVILDHVSIIKKMDYKVLSDLVKKISFDNNSFILMLPIGSR